MPKRSVYRPTKSPAQDLPAAVFAETDNALQVNAIVRDHDYGHFWRSAVFTEGMMRADRILAVTQRRISGLGNLPLSVTSADDRLKCRKASELLGGPGGTGKGGLFDSFFPPATIKLILFWGIFIGHCPVQKLWDNSGDVWAPRLKVWHPQFLRYDQSRRRLVLMTEGGQIDMPNPGEYSPEFFVWSPYGAAESYGWRRAVVRALALNYLEIMWGKRDRSRFSEVHGLPARVAKTPQGAPQPERRRFFRAVAMLGSEPTLEVPQGDGDKAGYGYELVESKQTAAVQFNETLDQLSRDVAILLLGSNLDTDSGANGGGSKALGQVHANVSADRIKEDAPLMGVLREEILKPWAYMQWGDEELAPIIAAETEPPEDDTQRVTVLKGLGDAVASLKMGFGDRIDEDALAERFDVPVTMSKVKYDELHPPIDPNDPNAQGGPGGADGDGADPEDAKDTAKDKADTAKLSAADLVALKAMAGDDGRKLLYPEKVAKQGAVLAGKELAEYRAALVDAVRGAKNEADAQARIAAAYRAVAAKSNRRDTPPLVSIVQQVRLMGNMGGRYTAVNQT